MSRSPRRKALASLALACAATAAPKTPAAADTCSGLQLTTLTPVATGLDPYEAAVGDFNRDGRLDVATADRTGNSVTVLFGDGAGGFPSSATVVLGFAPSDIATADINGDGLLDLVAGSFATAQIQVLQGLTAAPWFAPGAPLAVGLVPARVYLADFTRDAIPDLVLVDPAAGLVSLREGNLTLTFANVLATIDVSPVGAPDRPAAVAVADFNRDGSLDAAIAFEQSQQVGLYYGNGLAFPGFAWTLGPLAALTAGPADVAAGDVNRDGWLDLVTAQPMGGTHTVVLFNGGSLTPETAMPFGSQSRRVALVDLNHDGLLDLAGRSNSAVQDVFAYAGKASGPPWFDGAAAIASLPVSALPEGLETGDFTSDGRADLLVALQTTAQAVVVRNDSGTPCARASFAGAPRSFLAGDGPLASAAADFDEDGRMDLVVATNSELRVLRNANGELTALAPVTGISPFVRGVAVADMNADGDVDVVLAKGQPAVGHVQIYLGNGMGGLAPGVFQPSGSNTSALVVADFTGDGAPDVAAVSEDTGDLWFFKGNGLGALAAGTTTSLGGGTAPRALVAVDLDLDGKLDLAVAQSGTNTVKVLSGNGDGTFGVGVPPLGTGLSPVAIAAADLNGDSWPDIVTADNVASAVSVILQNGAGGFTFLPRTGYAVGTNPSAVALLNLEGSAAPDIAVTKNESSGVQRLSVLRNDGAGGFPFPRADYPVRNSPQAITPFDFDSDGLPDLAVPCRSADAVVVLVQRPPFLSAAGKADVRDTPRGAAAGDFDGDGDLDLAVANSVDDTLSLLNGDGAGGLSQYTTLPVAGAEAVVASDFNRDGRLDLAASAPGEATPSLAVFFGAGGGVFAPQPLLALGVGVVPDDLVAGDFDEDGDFDLAVCDKAVAGRVLILANDGSGFFSLSGSPAVGNAPTAIVTGDFDRDGDLDLAVVNDNSDDVVILDNSGGVFTVIQTLPLGANASPVALAAADFNADGTIDLAAASFGAPDRIDLLRNNGASFGVTAVPLDAPYVLQGLTAADVNRDGRPDLVALAGGVTVFRGIGGMLFEPPQTVVARHNPVAAVAGDFDRDGRVDLVVVNEASDDVSILKSSACQAQRLEISLQPAGCGTGAGPFVRETAATAYDEGGNVATCAAGTVMPAIVPGTGDGSAVLGGPGTAGAGFSNGVASFTVAASKVLTIDKPGRRYKLQLTAPGLPPLHTRAFTLGPQPDILGPNSVCPSSSGTWQMEGAGFYDAYAWDLSPLGPAPYDQSPFAFTPAVTLPNPPLAGPYTLGVTARVDGCVVTPTPRSIYFGALTSVSITPTGTSTVCVNCIGGSAKAVETGGGATMSRQWGYRTVSLGAITDLTGEVGETYVLKGASFPGPGTYYVVVRSTPSPAICGSTTTSNEWMVTVLPSVPGGEVQALAASSRGTSVSGENKLLWVNTSGTLDEVRIRWKKAPTGTSACLPPPDLAAPWDGEHVIPTPPPVTKAQWVHAGLELNTAYCYSVFVKPQSMPYSLGRTVKARPFDATAGEVKWAYATGGSAVAPPTISGEGVVALSNDRAVHVLTRGPTGGDWPASYVPPDLVGVAHSRSPVVPFVPPLLGLHDTVLFAADDSPSGYLHAINVRTGVRPWLAQPQTKPVTGAPSAIFQLYGGNRDALFVGTRDSGSDNQLRAIDLATGSLLEAYAPAGLPGPIGPILGSPAIDYAAKRLYFASRKRGGGDTLFCLEIIASPPVTPVFAYKWSRDLGDVSGSPVLRGGRVIVGTDLGVVYSIEAVNGLMANDRTYATFDGPVKGFLFPDRRNDDLIFATDTRVWSVSDDLPSMTLNWTFTGATNPSIVLYRPQTNYVYVGSALGKLYELDFSAATTSTPPTDKVRVLGDGLAQIGAPSLDIGPPAFIVVGSESGTLYGLQVPFVP